MCICTHFLAAVAVLLLSAATTTADPSDELCLTNLYSSLSNTQNLQNWTKTSFATPCQGSTSYLQGATCNNNRIFKLSLPNLSLSGTISPYLSNCTNLQTLDLSSNSLTGPIPVELQFLVNLAVLNLSLNSLNGEIPQQLTLCAYLNVIDLHGNRLTGAIPMQLGLLVRLNVLDLSGNRLEGMIPGNLRFNSSSYLGNKGLYGGPLGERKSKGGVSVMAIVGIGLASGFASLAVSFAAVCVWLRVTEERLREEEVGKHNGGVMPEY